MTDEPSPLDKLLMIFDDMEYSDDEFDMFLHHARIEMKNRFSWAMMGAREK